MKHKRSPLEEALGIDDLFGDVRFHISAVQPATAEKIAETNLIRDWDHAKIQEAAKFLVSKGNGHYEYHTKWASGATGWNAPGQFWGIVVKYNERGDFWYIA